MTLDPMHPYDARQLRNVGRRIATRLGHVADGNDHMAAIVAADLRCALDVVALRMSAEDRLQLREMLTHSLDALAIP